jgi:hypothetical protein
MCVPDAQVYGDGFCPNNEVMNKQPSIGSCDNVPQSVPNTMSYQYADFIYWLGTNAGGCRREGRRGALTF